MIGPRPVLPARLLLVLAVLVVPALMRDRYREEFRSELSELRWPAQMWQAGSIVTYAGIAHQRMLIGLTARQLPGPDPSGRARPGW